MKKGTDIGIPCLLVYSLSAQQWLRLGQIEASSQELKPGLHEGGKGPAPWANTAASTGKHQEPVTAHAAGT